MKIKWKKPSGVELESNDDPGTIKACEALGWEKIGEEAPADDPPGPDEDEDAALQKELDDLDAKEKAKAELEVGDKEPDAAA